MASRKNGQQRLSLPKFEGREPVGSKVSITGTAEKPRAIADVLHGDDEVLILARGSVSKVSHEFSDDGVVRAHTIKVSEVFVRSTDSNDVSDLFSRVADEERRAHEDAQGVQRLPTA